MTTKTTSIYARVTPELAWKVDAAARRLGLSRSDFVRTALAERCNAPRTVSVVNRSAKP